MFEAIVEPFSEGGWGMYPIALIALCVIIITGERIAFLFFQARINKADFVNTMHKYLFQGNLQRAITYCSSQHAPLANIIKAGLLRIDGSEQEIQAAMDEVALQEMPQNRETHRLSGDARKRRRSRRFARHHHRPYPFICGGVGR